MSWFSVDTLKAGFNSEALQGLTAKVKNAVPKLDPEMLQKLTLTTPELTAERQRIDQEEKRKERVRDSLAGMMPWETRDPERDILVEECKEAILKLSADKQNFYGPYHMPKVNVKLEDDDKNVKKIEGDDDVDDDDGQDAVDEAAVLAERDEARKGFSEEPSKEQLEKLKTLSPLPPRLEEFDLDAHVGLIQKLLKVDPMLVEMQSTLSGGGERERMFWRNYFFHCAWCRYEAGLSIDEIWSDQPLETTTTAVSASASASAVSVATKTDTGADIHVAEDMNAEQEITFGNHDDETTSKPEKAFASDPGTDPDAPFTTSKEVEKDSAATTAALAAATASHADASAESADYEMVGGSELDGTGLDDEPAVDYELDELEAEIARELED